MDKTESLNEQLTQFFVKWSQSEAKIRLYGSDMPQSQEIVEELYAAFEEILTTIPSFSIVKSTHGLEIVAHGTSAHGDHTCPLETSDYTTQVIQALERFDIHSLTFLRKLTLAELEQFFRGLHMPSLEIKQLKGLAPYLKDHQVRHVELDRMRLTAQHKHKQSNPQASQDVSQVAEQALEDLMRQTSTGLMGKEAPQRKKAFASTWERYLSDQMDASDFQSMHKNMIALAQDKPEMFVRAVQHMAAKQVKIETFLANLEQKLFDVGFSQEAVDNIAHQLGKPKKVLVDEAELARLRQIEKNYHPDLEERIEQSMAEISCLQQKLSDERERGDAIVRQGSQGVMVLDKDGCIMEMNP
ncbi:hypothetical protein ACFL3F_04790, partial [Planctomycetota bacterium]